MNLKKPFLITLLLGISPIIILLFIAIGITGSVMFSNVPEKEIVHDTIYIESKCTKNHYECPPPVEEPVKVFNYKKHTLDTLKGSNPSILD